LFTLGEITQGNELVIPFTLALNIIVLGFNIVYQIIIRTPIHFDHCGAIGHNLVVQCEKGEKMNSFIPYAFHPNIMNLYLFL
jgi:hypothetical protein